MSTATTNQPTSAASSLRRLVARFPVASFLLMAYAIGWTIFFPVVLSERGLITLPIDPSLTAVTSLASVFGLALPAFLVTAATGGKTGVRDLLGRCVRWRVGVGWYLLALFGLPVATVLGASVFFGAASLGEVADRWSLLLSMFLPEVLVPLVLIQLWEEAAWTGFMQDTLQTRHGPLLASVMVAPAFALMHLPLFLLNVPLSQFALGTVFKGC